MKKLGLFLIFLLPALVPAWAISLDALPGYHDEGMKLYVRGTQKLQDGDFVGALEDLRHATRSRPDLAEAFHNMGFAFEKTGNLKNAAAAYERALALKPTYASALNNLGYLLSTTESDVQRAVTLCQRAVELEPSSANYRDSLGWAYYKAGRTDDAILHFRSALKLDPTFYKPYFNLGLCEFNNKNYSEAAKFFSTTLRMNPSYLKAYIPLGNCYEQMQQNNKALYVYQQAMTKAPENSPVRRHLEKKVKELSEAGKSYYFQNVKKIQGGSKATAYLYSKMKSVRPGSDQQANSAMSSFESSSNFTPVKAALQTGPVNYTPSQSQSQTLFAAPSNSTMFEGASREISRSAVSMQSISNSQQPARQLTVMQERELERKFSLSKSYLDRGLVREASKELEEIITYGGNSLVAKQARNQLLKVQRIIDEKAQDTAKIHLDMGKEFFRAGNYDMAESEYRKSLTIAPDNAETYKDLALLHYNQGKYQDAYEESKQAIALDRTMKEAYVVLGSLYAKKGRIEEALNTLKRVKEISGEHDAVDELVDRMIVSLNSGS